mgnify:CR=1 FL=1
MMVKMLLSIIIAMKTMLLLKNSVTSQVTGIYI